MDGSSKFLVHKGIRMARDLESGLPDLAAQPHTVAVRCQEIARTFSDARESIIFGANSSSEGFPWVQSSLGCLGATGSNTTEMFTGNAPVGSTTIPHEMEPGGLKVQSSTVAVPTDSGRDSGSSSHGTSRRRDRADREITRVAVPEIGNPELPPDDGHTWRKYGQKKILNSKFPRGYFRCTHRKLYDCQAKRTVQRLDTDPSTFEVTYIHHHICHLSSTAPSLAPASNLSGLGNHNHNGHHLMSSALSPISQGPRAPQGGVIISTNNGTTVPRGTTSFGDKDNTEYPVVQLADAMFNSSHGNGSTNGIMDLIFTTNHDNTNEARRL